MNKKLKIALIYRYSNRGFAMPIAVGLGLVILLIAATLIVRSQGDQTTASTQKSTAQSLSVAEAGVTRIQAFLIKNPGLVNQSYPWTTYLSNLGSGCKSLTEYTEAQEFDNWITVGSGTDRFKVVSYTPSSTEGVLVLEGQARKDSNVKSTSRLQVKLAFDRSRIPSFNPPGAWAQNFGLGNNRIEGDVIDAACPPGSIDATKKSQITGGTITPNPLNNPLMTLPPPLPVPTVCTGTLVYPTTCGAMSLNTITGNETLPRATDVFNADGEYVYYVPKNGSGDSIDLKGSDKLVITPGKKVKIYLEGNLNTQGGGTKIEHDCTGVVGCSPTNFQIYGGANTTSIIFGGSNTVDAFIFAPNAVNSGVNGSAQIRGSIWLKEWDRANGNHLVIKQTGAWNNIPLSLWPARIAPISSWERQETN